MSLKKLDKSPFFASTALDTKSKASGDIAPSVAINFPKSDLILAPVKNQKKKVSQKVTTPGLSEIKIEPDRVIPLMVSHVFNHEMDSFKDLVDARELENRITNSTIMKLYEAIESGPMAGTITEMLEEVDQEILDAEENIAALESLKVSLEQLDQTFDKSEQNKLMIKNVGETLERMGSDPLFDPDVMSDDFINQLSFLTSISKNILDDMRTSSAYIQSLADAEYCLRTGVSVGYLIESGQRGLDPTRSWSRPHPAVRSIASKNVKSLSSIGIGDDRNYDGVFSRNALSRVPIAENLSPLEMVGYYCSVLSKEFLISSGMGRLSGTPLGQSFGASSGNGILSKLFGTANLNYLTTEASSAGSLSDYVLVSTDGSLRPKKKQQKVLVLEGDDSQFSSTRKFKGSRYWLDTVKTKPLNNTVSQFDGIINEAIDKFESAEDFLKDLLQREEERILLTPRGLFTRILSDFATLVEGITVEANADIRSKSAASLSLLSMSAQGNAKTSKKYKKLLRRRLHILACRLVAEKRADAEDEERLLRLTAREASEKFQAGLTGLGHDKNDLANSILYDAKMFYGGSSKAKDMLKKMGRDVAERTGQQIFDSVVDDAESDGLMPMIVKIFEDMSEEASTLAKVDTDDKTYLREGGATRYSGFDGAITIAFILECFIILTDLLIDVELETDAGAAQMFRIAVDHTQNENSQKKARELFFSRKQIISYDGGPGTKMNKMRKFLVELCAASDGNDLGNLFDGNGQALSVPNCKDSTNLGASQSVTPNSFIDVMKELAKEDDVTVTLFSIAKSYFSSLNENTETLRQKASALRGDDLGEDPTPEVLLLKSLKQTNLGSKFIRSLTDAQIRMAKKRVSFLQKITDSGYIFNETKPEIYRAIRFFLEERDNEFTHAVSLAAGLPAASVSKSIVKKGLSAQTAGISYDISKKDELFKSLLYDDVSRLFPTRLSLSEETVISAFEEEEVPQTFSSLILSSKYHVDGEDDPLTGSEIIEMSSNPTQEGQNLRTVFESFIMKKMYGILLNLSLEEEDITNGTDLNYDSRCSLIMKEMANLLGQDSSIVGSIFTHSDGRVKLSDFENMKKILLPKKIEVSGSLVWSEPSTNSEYVDLLYAASATKPFFAGRVKDFVLTQRPFDRIDMMFIDLDEFRESTSASEMYSFYSSKIHKGSAPVSIEKFKEWLILSKSPDRLNIDTLYLGAEVKGEV